MNFLRKSASHLKTRKSKEHFRSPKRMSAKRCEIKSQRIKVMLRIRPLNEKENQSMKTNHGNIAIQTINSTTIQIEDINTKFLFDEVFCNESQEEVYGRIAKETVEDVLSGYNGTIFAYGPTGTGKTYTMIGMPTINSQFVGIIPRTSKQIFHHTSKLSNRFNYKVTVSVLEIYKENLRDLLLTKNPKELRIKESPFSGIYVDGLSECIVTSKEEFLKAVLKGGENRVIAETKGNQIGRAHV